MNVFVLGGFLGSGKTTILLQLAAYLNNISRGGQSGSSLPRLVILENEIGDEGIDDKVIRAEGYHVEVMTVGCICCLMLGTLIMMVERIQEELHPDWLIIEATGVADTTTIVRTLEYRMPELGGVSGVVVADAERYDLLMDNIPGFIKGQLMHADAIMLNKIDLLDPRQRKEIEGKLDGLRSSASLRFSVTAVEPIDHHVWKELVKQNEQLANAGF